ncbi:MAG: class I SAM-dependent methyltransferase, partial [Candidatus Aenigmatarchaeota archaeon]
MNNEAKFFDKKAEIDYKVLDDDDYLKVLKLHFPELFNKNMKILEIGCGCGAFGRHFKGKVKGIEISPKLAKKANNFFPCVLGDIRHLPFADKSFDIIFSGFVLHHVVNDISKVVKECKRVLKNKGKIFLIEPNAKSLFEEMQRFRNPKGYSKEERAITVNELRKWFKDFDCEFTVEHYTYRVQKNIRLYK